MIVAEYVPSTGFALFEELPFVPAVTKSLTRTTIDALRGAFWIWAVPV